MVSSHFKCHGSFSHICLYHSVVQKCYQIYDRSVMMSCFMLLDCFVFAKIISVAVLCVVVGLNIL